GRKALQPGRLVSFMRTTMQRRAYLAVDGSRGPCNERTSRATMSRRREKQQIKFTRRRRPRGEEKRVIDKSSILRRDSRPSIRIDRSRGRVVSIGRMDEDVVKTAY